jgi:hypothetical protein
MNFTSVALLAIASMLATATIAQDGNGHGPPYKAPIIVAPRMPVPMPTSPTGTVHKFFQPNSGLAPATR